LVVLELDREVMQLLKNENNVIAAHCYNTRGAAYLDFGLFTEDELNTFFGNNVNQVSVNVLPTQTYYSFYCGPVKLDLKFTSPLILDNLDLLGSPINYITYTVTSTDNRPHDVQIFFSATPEWVVNSLDQEIETEYYQSDGFSFLKTGTKEQNILGAAGDNIRIDWGYFYLGNKQTPNNWMSFGQKKEMRSSFVQSGVLPDAPKTKVASRLDNEMVELAFVENLGAVGTHKKVEGHLLIGYDDIKSIQYFGTNLDPYWKNKHENIESAFALAEKEYPKTMKLCEDWDYRIMEDSRTAGGQQYAEICAMSYRQSIAAHKLVLGPKGQLFFFSKENNSNGSIGTVDVTYPSIPLFLLYNTDIAKAMLEFIFEYCESGKWNKPFAPHDIGTYPLANGQTYIDDMPVEESGNMVIMTAAICKMENSANYAKKHWEILTKWAEYLIKEGLDPKDQLCTEDFAGYMPHNTNLSAKAIMAIACYGLMAEMLEMPNAGKYKQIAKNMMVEWEKLANDGDHYRLAFDQPNTWSQKYNFVWENVLNLNVVPQSVLGKEVEFYLKQQNEYGLPLDNRYSWSRVGEIIWCATFDQTGKSFTDFVIPVWKFINETPTRVPIGDWYETKNAQAYFGARSVVGGVFIKSLDHYLKNRDSISK
ncbi:MAG: DUF4965 domain-containing protein, partial [Parabacteroides sp.]|nr:DUF4965 domain-containing protein [Parabacteroides sp.]